MIFACFLNGDCSIRGREKESIKNRRRKKETTARSIRLSMGISDCRFRVACFVKTVCVLPGDR